MQMVYVEMVGQKRREREREINPDNTDTLMFWTDAHLVRGEYKETQQRNSYKMIILSLSLYILSFCPFLFSPN